jgi:PKD repeat protein
MIQRLFNQFSQSSSVIRIVLGAVIGIWVLVVVALIAATVLLLERPGQALPPAEETGLARIVLEPNAAPSGASVTVRGEEWSPGDIVLIYLVAPGKTEPTPYAIAGSTVDAEGRFANQFFVPSEPGWLEPGLARVIAQASEGGVSAQAFFSVLSAPEESVVTPTASIEPTVEPTATPTEVPSAPTPTPQPGSPMATATTDVNIRGGPGTTYPVLGVLRTGQSAEITGVSADGGWWQIRFSGAADGRGWLSARYVSAQNTKDVPLVQAPALPPTATPVPTPVTIRDWRGEYYNNQNLSGNPVLVRNDVSVNFDWGAGVPSSGMPADGFSVRWSRDASLTAGTYRFYAYVDDGVRLWVDGVLVMDRWHDSAPTTYTVDVYLTDGQHSLRMEYYEHTGGALAQLAWERLEHYPDWKGEYYSNPDLGGVPALVRNDVGVTFNWGPNSPGPGVPADNFSARWSRSWHFSSGTYRFKVVVDDGARLWVDDRLVIDRWRVGEPNAYTGDVTLSEGTHRLRLEYFEFRYDAQVHLSWERVDSFQDWKGEYYDNRNLGGDPILVRNDASINFNWENGSPGPDVPRDNFSARWTRKADFKDGIYVFSIWVDDGARLWIDDSLVIDGWRDGSVRLLQAERQLSRGTHRVRVEYYERGGTAQIAVNWSRKQEPVNQPPQAVPGGPYTADEGSLVNFDGSGSKDVDGKIAKYEWDFNYDGKTFAADAAGQAASTRYPDGPATIVIALRVTDDRGASHVATAQVQVKNVAPAVEAGGPYAGQTGSPITMAGTASDPGLIDQTGLVYVWDFGDGTGGTGPIVSHSYAQPGGYTVKLTVTDKDGAQGTDTASVQVLPANQPPTAVISGPSQGIVGEPLNFSGRDSADGDGHIQSYAWDFGDETKGGGVDVTHSYVAPGNYQVILTVTDNGGLTAKATHTVQINPPVPDNLPPTAVISGPTTAVVSETVQFDASSSSDSDGSIVSYAWDFGDLTIHSGITVTHVYTQAGTYTVTLTVVDDDSLEAKTIHTIVVAETAAADAG